MYTLNYVEDVKKKCQMLHRSFHNIYNKFDIHVLGRGRKKDLENRRLLKIDKELLSNRSRPFNFNTAIFVFLIFPKCQLFQCPIKILLINSHLVVRGILLYRLDIIYFSKQDSNTSL